MGGGGREERGVSSVCSVVTEECQQARNKCEVCKRGEEGGR